MRDRELTLRFLHMMSFFHFYLISLTWKINLIQCGRQNFDLHGPYLILHHHPRVEGGLLV